MNILAQIATVELITEIILLLIDPAAQISNEISNEIEVHTVAPPLEEETEQFIPTVTDLLIICVNIITSTIVIITSISMVTDLLTICIVIIQNDL